MPKVQVENFSLSLYALSPSSSSTMSSLRLNLVARYRSRSSQIFISSYRICVSIRSTQKLSNCSVNSQTLTMRVAFYFVALAFNFDSICAIFKAGQNVDSENESFKTQNTFTSKLQFSYAVKIFSRENKQTLSGFSCSGSIVHPLWIITDAHCVYSFNVSSSGMSRTTWITL